MEDIIRTSIGVPAVLRSIANAIRNEGGVAYLIGGAVRDHMFGMIHGEDMPTKDWDVEVFSVQPDRLAEILSSFGSVDAVGKSFGVLKLHRDGEFFDFSVPRTESKSGKGHKGFIPSPDPDLSPFEATLRRDLTVNSFMYDIVGETVIDYHGAVNDVRERRLSATSSDRFPEDPLRVKRLMYFGGLLDCAADDRTLELARGISDTFVELPKERIWGEWDKFARKSKVPSTGMINLLGSGWLVHYPEIDALVGLPQEPSFHPEGDVWNHTLHALDASVGIAARERLSPEERSVLFLATLCHDFGKASTTAPDEGGIIRSKGHEQAGIAPTVSFLNRIGAPETLLEEVPRLVGTHLRHLNSTSPRSVRRLAREIAPSTIEMLSFVIEADHSGRPPLPPSLPENARVMVEIAREEGVRNQAPVRIVMGRHLLPLGYLPGRSMGEILLQAEEAQLDGVFHDLDGGIAWVKSNFQPQP